MVEIWEYKSEEMKNFEILKAIILTYPSGVAAHDNNKYSKYNKYSVLYHGGHNAEQNSFYRC